jgi:hypothetical protein
MRTMKAHPALKDGSADQALARVERAIAAWPVSGRVRAPTVARKAAVQWAHYFGVDAEDARVEFLSNWDRVRCLPGYAPLDYAIEQAEKRPIEFGGVGLAADTDGYKRFLTIAGWLQVAAGNRNILLPCELVGARLNVTPMTVSRYREWASYRRLPATGKGAHLQPQGALGRGDRVPV